MAEILEPRREAAISRGPRTPLVHPLYVRITHWVNAVAVLLMIASGWRIYDASPLFPFSFPSALMLGDGLADALLFHLAAMWIFLLNGLIYAILSLATGHIPRKLLPIKPKAALGELKAALAGRLRHEDITRYNALQRLAYLAVLLTGVVTLGSGLALWKPVQLRELAQVFGGYEGARLVHFFAMAALCAFLIIHVSMALLVPRTLRAMLLGR